MSPRLSSATRLSTSLSTLKSVLTLKSTFLSGSTLTSAILGTFWRALGPPEPTSQKRHFQNCYQLASDGQFLATRAMWWPGVDQRMLIDGNPKIPFFGHPVDIPKPQIISNYA